MRDFSINVWRDIWASRGFIAVESKYWPGQAYLVKCTRCGKYYQPQSSARQYDHYFKHEAIEGRL